MIEIEKIARVVEAKIIGDASQVISKPNRIELVQNGEITFLQHSKYLSQLKNCSATAIVSTQNLVDESLPFIWLVVKDPALAFAQIVEMFYPKQTPNFQHHTFFKEFSAEIDTDVQVGYGAYIGHGSKILSKSVIYPQVYIGHRVHIGENVTIHSGAKILDDTIIGNACIIHAGAVIGADGFGFVPKSDGTLQKVPQMGNVILEDDVEIGANTCIDRAMLGSTIIKKGVKLDNLIQIGHNVQIGEYTVIAAQTGIAGSCQIGKYNQIGGQAGIAPHINTATGVKINAQSGVSKSIVQSNTIVTGTPAVSYMDFNRTQVFLKRLPKEIQTLKDEINIKNTKLG